MATPKPLGSVSRAISILEYLAAQDPDGVALGTISRDMAINKATVYNTLATLKDHAWVDQHPETGYYSLGDGIAPIAQYQTSTKRAVELLRPHIAALGARFNELVHLGQLVDTDIIYLDKVEPDRAIRVVSEIGRRATALTTSLGRALVGSLENRDERVTWFMSAPDIAGLSKSKQNALLASVQANFARLDSEGYTEEVEENEPGIACVAVPLVNAHGTGLAISVSAPVERMTPEYRAQIAAGIRDQLKALPRDVKLRPRPLNVS